MLLKTIGQHKLSDFGKSLLLLFFTFLSLIFASSTATAVWDGNIAIDFSGGNGTESDPFLISDGSQLALMASLVNSEATHAQYSELCYKLTDNIDLGGVIWDPIGTGSYSVNSRTDIYPFYGTFDGDGHTVSGLYINGAKTITWKEYTLKTCTVGGTTYNMYTEDYQPIYDPELDADGNPLTDENGNPVYKYSTKSAVQCIGLFGFNCGYIKNLTVSEPEIIAGFNKAVAGGICGASAKRKLFKGQYKDGEYLRTTPVLVANTGVVENCKVIGGSITLTSTPLNGGSSGSSVGSFNCLGGISGNGEGTLITGCFSSVGFFGENVSGDTIIGGIVGRMENLTPTKSKINLCTSFCTIDVSCASSSYSIHKAGGIAGIGDGSISECSFDGDIRFGGGGAYSLVSAGGIIGYNVRITIDHVFSSGNVTAECIYDTPSCSVRAGGIVGSGSATSAIGSFTLCNANALSVAGATDMVQASAVNGNYSSGKFASIYYDEDITITECETQIDSPTGIKCRILFDDESSDCYEKLPKFSEYYESVKDSDWVYTSDMSSKIIFVNSFSDEATTHILNAAGEYLSYERYSSDSSDNDVHIVIPYAVTSVNSSAFDTTDTDSISCVIIPSSVDTASKEILADLFENKTVVLKTSTQDKFFSTTGTDLYGDYMINSAGTVYLYVGANGAHTVMPGNAKIVETSGLYAVSCPSSVRIANTFTPSYLTYVSNLGEIPLIISPDTDFYEYCDNDNIPYSLLGDINGDGNVSLADLSLLYKYLEGVDVDVEAVICDLIYDSFIDIRDLHHFLKYFADTDTFLGEEND